MANSVQPLISMPEGGDARNNSKGGNAHNGEGGNTRNGAGGPSSGSQPLLRPQDPADPLSEAHLKCIAEHIACFLAALHSSGSSTLFSGKCKHLGQDS